MKLYLNILIFLICFTISDAFIRKLKNFLTGKGKPKAWEFVLGSILDYPRNEPKKIKIIRRMWQEYYDCLNSQYRDLGLYQTILPEAIMALEGTSVLLDCKVCVAPSDTTRTDDVEWKYRTIPPKNTTPVELGEHKFISPEDKVLHMYSLSLGDTGQYICQKSTTVTAAYFLEVVNASEPTLVVKPQQSAKGPYAAPPEYIPNKQLKLFSNWGEWSQCNACGVVGKRIRYGFCTVTRANEPTSTSVQTPTEHSSQSTAEESSNSENSTLTTQSSSSTTTEGTTVMTTAVPLPEDPHSAFSLFPSGLPCRSLLLPKALREIQQIRERKSEIMVGLCKEKCPQEEVFTVMDEQGNTVETANNSAGFYSTLQGIPPTPPDVQRRTIYEETITKRIILTCPGNLNSDAPLQWQIGAYNVNPDAVLILSHGRIFINIYDNLVIKNPRQEDSNIYSCWQKKELAGTIRLIVTKRLALNFNHQVMMLTMVLILGAFLLVFYRAFRGRNRLTAH